ncbi:hypothetical protein AB0M28_00565 [Streptomyces sp. NPDC051940]|uniref:hypothetical protein n=1 Tax=Streptomyces sp. NPDC051940 TaxID=3155675 RepID=UPI00342374A9
MGRIDYNRRDGRPDRPDLSCPRCGRDDKVAAVPAVYRDGHRRVRVRDSDGDTSVRTEASLLAKELTPQPEPSGWSCLVTGLGILAGLATVGTFIAYLVTSDDNDSASGGFSGYDGFADADGGSGGVPGWIPLTAFLAAVALIALAVHLRSRFRRDTAGRPAAEALWERGWYCKRCGTVHFQGDPRARSVSEFRREVWTAGGYGHLADRFRVV